MDLRKNKSTDIGLISLTSGLTLTCYTDSILQGQLYTLQLCNFDTFLGVSQVGFPICHALYEKPGIK